jgi:hypothetical protein
MLDSDDIERLRRYEQKLQIVRDRVRGVAEGWATGFYLWGEGGIGKSWVVEDELRRIKAPYHLTNSRLTGKGLFELLEELPDAIHLLEDMESLCKDERAAGVLRSALWSTNPDQRKQHQERRVTWRVAREKREVFFTGGVIVTMNTPLDDLPTLRAVRTRIAHLHLQPEKDEVAAVMKKIATLGHRHGEAKLTPEECLEVYRVVIDTCDEVGRNYDIRMLINSFADRIQYDSGHSETHWIDLVASRMKERVFDPVTRRKKVEDLRAVAYEIEALDLLGTEKLSLWSRRTGKGKSAYYARLGGR